MPLDPDRVACVYCGDRPVSCCGDIETARASCPQKRDKRIAVMVSDWAAQLLSDYDVGPDAIRGDVEFGENVALLVDGIRRA
jgi:hypothetical protein